MSRARSEHSIINVRVLILIYVLLCLLTVLFSRIFFIETFSGGEVPGILSLVVFFTIPAVLLVFLGISVFNLCADIIVRRPGSKFKARLMAYFTIIVIFAATPATVMTATAINEVTYFWKSINAASATKAANSFIVENYSLHVERFDSIVRQTDFSNVTSANLPHDIAAVQVFTASGGSWSESSFAGEERYRLTAPPSLVSGHTSRELPRDLGTIRFVQIPAVNTIRVISYNLGYDFDWGMAAIENMTAHFRTIDSLQANLRSLTLFYYAVFFFPTLLMTIIIAISFTRRVTHPIVELTEATRRVAEGDFSIQILARRGDELGLLIRSFNAMVRDLEKSRIALIKAEKISIWQNMAQQLAHEVKNPLTPIKLSAERVLRRWQNEPERVDEILESSMKAIIHEVEGLSGMLNEFRTLSKPMEPSQSWTNLRETVEELITPLSTPYPKIQFSIEHVEAGISIKIDKHRLSQVLTNLVLNAIDAMGNKGLIEIRTDLVKKREINYCRLSIKDSGKGISAQEAQLVFTPYFTTKASGTGLGLLIVERIVNDHGGTIWFNSAEGAGTTFYIDLPAENTQKEV